MKTIEELRDKMAGTVTALENKEISTEEAMAICRAAAVVIGSLRVELQYRQSRAEKPSIQFMGKKGDSKNRQKSNTDEATNPTKAP